MSRRKEIYGGIVILIAVCGVVFTTATIKTRLEAESFLHELQTFQIGETSYERVQAVAIHFRNYIVDGAKTCVPNDCSVTLKFENMWLRNLHLARWTTFGATLLVRDGRLHYVSTGMTMYSRDQVISAGTFLSDEGHETAPFRVVTKRWNNDQPWQVIVQLTPQAMPQQKDLGFSFNLGCLDKLGGCKDSSDLLPSAWKENRDHAWISDHLTMIRRKG
jgi:hypothetical protein